ncbi:MAG TPA: hypothetical protein VGL40_06340 [Bacillota bacterium]
MSDRRLQAFLVSLAALLFELTTVRLISYSLNAYYAYASLAMAAMGGAVGAALVTRRTDGVRRDSLRIAVGVLFPLALAGLLLPWPGPARPLMITIAAGLPYLAVGGWMSDLFRRHGQEANQLYFYDLAGAASGVAAGYLAMEVIGPLRLAIFVALIVLGWGVAGRVKRVGITVAAALVGVAVLGSGAAWYPRLNRGLLPAADKPMSQLMAVTGSPVWSRWSPFGRVDVVPSVEPRKLVIYTDGTAATDLVRYQGDLSTVSFLGRESGSLPFILKPGGKTLIIGPGGGKDILMALLTGSQEITAVEVNPTVVQAVREVEGPKGDPYADPRVKAVIGDGRSFVRGTGESYDLIYLSVVMTETSERAGWGLSESYIYTAEAVGDYLAKLLPGGELAFVLHGSSDIYRAIPMVIQAFAEQGLTATEAAARMAVFTQENGAGHAHARPILLVTADPITGDQASWIKAAADAGGATALYLPGVAEGGVLGVFAEGLLTLDQYLAVMAKNGFDDRPPTDDRPFFYASADSAGRVVLWILTALAVIGWVIIASIGAGGSGDDQRRDVGLIWAAASGAGYMAVEVALMQTVRRLVPEPTLSIATVLVGLLLASATGSYLSGRMRWRPEAVAGGAAALTALFLLTLPKIAPFGLTWLGGAPLLVRLLTAMVTIALPGLAMGVPFPTCLKRSRFPAALWAVNGVFSVVGSVAALYLSLRWGLTVTFWTGAAVYLGLAVGLFYQVGLTKRGSRSILVTEGTTGG